MSSRRISSKASQLIFRTAGGPGRPPRHSCSRSAGASRSRRSDTNERKEREEKPPAPTAFPMVREGTEPGVKGDRAYGGEVSVSRRVQTWHLVGLRTIS